MSTCHFDWLAIPQTVWKGVAASTMGTKDPLSSDECSSSGRSELYPLLSVSNIEVVSMLSVLWVPCGMSSIHVCAVYSARTQDSVDFGVWSTLLPAYVLSLWILNGLWGLCPLLTLIELPSLIQFVMEYWRPPWGTKDPLSSDECSWSGRSEFYPPLSVSKIKVICQLSLLWVQSWAYVLCYEFWMVYEDCVHFSLLLSCHPSYSL